MRTKQTSEQINARRRATKAAKSEEVNEKARAWRAANRERLNAKAREKRANDGGKTNAEARARRAKDPGKARALLRAWYANNPEKVREYQTKDPARNLWRAARLRAHKRGLPFDLEVSDAAIPSACPVLGIPLTPCLGKGLTDSSPTVDRIDNAKGYVKGNVLVVSWRANRIKNDATVAELRAITNFYESLS